MVLMHLVMLLAPQQAPADLVAGEVKRCATDMKFTEGPVADGKGNVYYSDLPNDRIMKWDGKENAVWRENSGGANGLKFDKDGNLVVWEGKAKRMTRISMADQKGNLYTTTGKGVEIFAPDGKALGVIAVPEGPANCAFDGRTLFITARKSLYRVPMKVSGN